MAAQKKSASRSRSSNSRANGGRSASQKPEKYRFAQNVDGEETVAEEVYRAYAEEARKGSRVDPDVLIDVPVVKVDSIHLELDDLRAHVALQAKVMELVNLNVGVDIKLGKVVLDIKGVEAQALLKVRLDHVTAIVDRVLTTVDRNPKLVESIGRAVEDVGEGAGHTLGESGEAVEDIGEGTGDAVGEIGSGAGDAVEGIGEGAGDAAGNLDQVLANAGQAAGQAGQAAGGGGGGGGGGLEDVAGLLSGDHPTRAKEAAKLTVKEIGVSAKEKMKELGERRRHRKAEEHDATDRAYEVADELGVDLDEVEGSGADGRITVNDVRRAASE
ncbi:MAG TPA: E3 binding domain-containing protein [Solirubrobacterales bacterium]|nr:E3 binding domain-containing protein [Solirubrobacterales bacterium]